MEAPESSATAPASATKHTDTALGSFTNRYATPLTTGLFAVSAISGIALFLHWAPGLFHEMHEWLSVVLLAPFGLHAWRNWKSLTLYAKRGTLVLPLIAAVAVAMPFAVSGWREGGSGGNPAFRTMALMTQARLADLAPILHTTPDALLTTLRREGYQASSGNDTLDTIAAGSGKPASAILFTLMPRSPNGE